MPFSPARRRGANRSMIFTPVSSTVPVADATTRLVTFGDAPSADRTWGKSFRVAQSAAVRPCASGMEGVAPRASNAAMTSE